MVLLTVVPAPPPQFYSVHLDLTAQDHYPDLLPSFKELDPAERQSVQFTQCRSRFLPQGCLVFKRVSFISALLHFPPYKVWSGSCDVFAI